MDARDIARQRLLNQHVAKPRLRATHEIVFHLGAVQSQDLGMGKWAIGVRLKGATERAVEAAIESGDVVRMHLLRPTWHFAAREDARCRRLPSDPVLLTLTESQRDFFPPLTK